MAVEDRIHAVVDPIVEELELELVDLIYGGGRLRIVLDHPDGLGTAQLTRATRMISHEIDLTEPVTGSYTLEVTSPGVERELRTTAHYVRSIGEQVSIKLRPNEQKLRRIKGVLLAADDDGVTIEADDETHTFPYEEIAKTKTVFDWGPAPKPGSPKNKAKKTGPKDSGSIGPVEKEIVKKDSAKKDSDS